ncbi:MAG: tRNA-binding protein [Putridiphycobacter sp.]
MNTSNTEISWSDFTKVDIRVGTIIHAETFKAAKNPALKLQIDFGPLGIKKSSAQITQLYAPDQIIGQQIIAVVNFPPKQIANIMSECLVLGALSDKNNVTLLTTERPVVNGAKIS